MTATTHPSPSPPAHGPEKAITLALSLADAERAIHAFALDQVDAIVDADGRAYLLRPAQEHLRQSESRLRAIIESIPDVITVVNRGGVILSQNRAVTEVLGYEPEALVGSRFFDLIHEHDVPAVHFAFLGVIGLSHESATVRFRHRARDGSWREIEATLGVLHDGSSPGVVFVLRPIIGHAQGRTNPSWPDTLAVSPAGGEREFIILSHGRQMPFMGPRFGVAALDGNLENDSANPAIESVWQRHELKARLLEQPIDLTKGGRLQVRLRLESVDAHEVAHSVLDLCHREIAATQIEVLLDLRAEENIVRADWARLLQAMCKLLSYAVECSSPGSTISITSSNRVPGRFIFGLAAHGIGIESALWPRIFDSPQRCELPAEQLRRGFDIARRLTEAQGGTLTASSEGPGRGATFHLTLNTAPRSSVARAIVPIDEPWVPSQPVDSLSILLVEGSGDAQLAGQMERCGHFVTAAPDIPAAIALTERYRFDLLIIDVTLPDRGGYELMERLRLTHPSLSGIALGGFGMTSEIYQSREAGFSAHLVRPVTLDSFQTAIQTVVAISREPRDEMAATAEPVNQHLALL